MHVKPRFFTGALPRPSALQRSDVSKSLGAPLVGLFVLCVTGVAKAACDGNCEYQLGYRPVLHGGAHLSYGLGAAVVPGAVETGFRHQLELAGAIGPGREGLSLGNSITGSTDPITGPLFGASGLLGLGSSPSYALVEGGYGSGALVALGGFLGFGARLDSGVTPVVGLRGNLDVLLLNVGIRTVVSFERKPDLLICLTLGLGRY
jgi:hypothetical protein